MTSRRFLVEGRVQGVGYRWFAQRAAQRLGLAGWVRNLGDGRVEVVAVGPAGALAEMAACLAHGPPSAKVTKVDSFEISDQGKAVSGFQVVC